MGRGRPIDRRRWPADRPRRTFFELLDQVHRDHGTRSLSDIAAGMNLAARSRVSALLRGTMPADEGQVRDLIRALGGSEGDAARAVMLYRTIRSSPPDGKAPPRSPTGPRQPATAPGHQARPFAHRESYDPIIEAMEQFHSVLLDREQEMAELAGRIGRKPGYYAVEAPMYAGKTALLTALRRRLIDDGCAVIIFFVRRGSDDTAAAFLPKVITQLLEFLGEPVPELGPAGVADTREARQTQFADLWERACRLAGRPVVLIVDGLDEQRRETAGEPTVSGLLPAGCGPWGRVLISSRPNPELSAVVPMEHPLAALTPGRRFTLQPSRHARAHQEKVERELRGFLARGEDQTELMVGMYALGGGPVSDDDVADLLECSGIAACSPLRIAREREHLMASLLTVRAPDGAVYYTFGHEAQRAHIARRLGVSGQRTLVKRVLAWAGKYASDKWPDSTPTYLRDHLHTFIQAHKPPDAAELLVGLLSDERRRLFWRTYGHLAGMSEALEVAFEALAPAPATPDQVTLYLRALQQRLNIITIAAVPYSLLKALVATGQLTRALGVAMTMSRFEHNKASLLHLAGALAECADPGDAIDLITKYGYSWDANSLDTRMWIKAITESLTERGEILPAAQTAGHIHHHAERAKALADIAVRATGHGSELIEQVLGGAMLAAEAAAGSDRSFALACIARSMLGLGQAERAVKLAREALHVPDEEHPPDLRAESPKPIEDALRLVADVFLRTDQLEDAVRAAKRITNTFLGAATVARVVERLGQAGRIEQAKELVQLCVDLDAMNMYREEGVDSRLLIYLLSGMAQTTATAARPDAYQSILADAEASIQKISSDHTRAEANIRLARQLTRAGRVDQAAAIATLLGSPEARAKAWSQMAGELLHAGDHQLCLRYAERASESAQLITDCWSRAKTLVELARVLIDADDGARAARTADHAVAACCELTDRNRRVNRLRDLVELLLDAGLRDQGIELTDRTVAACSDIADPGERVELLLELAGLHSGAGEREHGVRVADAAVTTCSQIADASRRMASLGDLALYFTESGLHERAAEVTESGFRIAEAGGGYTSGKATALADVARGFARAGKADRAATLAERTVLLAEIKERRPTRGDQTARVLRLLAEAGCLDQALRLACPPGGKPQPARIQAVITGQVASSRFQQAVDTALFVSRQKARDLDSDLADDILRATAIKLIAASAIGHAEQLFASQPFSLGYVRDGDDTVRTTFRTLVRAGFLDFAMRLAAAAEPQARHRVDVLTQLGLELAEGGFDAEALDVAGQIAQLSRSGNGWGRASGFRQAVRVLIASGEPGSLAQLAQEIVRSHHPWIEVLAAMFGNAGWGGELASITWSDSDREIVLSEIAKILINAGQVEAAISIAGDLRTRPARQEPLGLAAGKLAADGQLDRALRLKETLTGNWRPDWAAEQIVLGLLRSGNVDDAERIALAIGLSPDWPLGTHNSHDHGRAARVKVIEHVINGGQITRALRIAELFGRAEADDRSLERVAGYLIAADRHDAAVELARRIHRPKIRMETFIRIAKALGRAERDASEAICEASRAAAEISDINDAWLTTGAVFGAAVSLSPATLAPLGQFWESVTGLSGIIRRSRRWPGA